MRKSSLLFFFFFFFFQAEDGIRDGRVTGVQTCALPILAAVPDKVIDDLIIRGSIDEIDRHVRRYLAAGIDTAFLSLSTVEQDPARKREVVRSVIRALAPGKPPGHA